MKKTYKNVNVIINDIKDGFNAQDTADFLVELNTNQLRAIIAILAEDSENETIVTLSQAINGKLYNCFKENN